MIFIFALPIVVIAAVLVLLYKPEKPVLVELRTVVLVVLLLFITVRDPFCEGQV